MSFEKSACLAALLLSFPLVVTAEPVLAAVIYANKADGPDENGTVSAPHGGTLNPSGYGLGDYQFYIYIGYADATQYDTAKKAEASCNSYTFENFNIGDKVTQLGPWNRKIRVYGGYAISEIQSETISNKLILKDTFTLNENGSGGSWLIGGYASSTSGTATASGNEVTLEKELKVYGMTRNYYTTPIIYGGWASISYVEKNSEITINKNIVTINKGVSFLNRIKVTSIYGGYATYGVNQNVSADARLTADVTENEVHITDLTGISPSYLAAGWVKKNSSTLVEVDAKANNNKGIWSFAADGQAVGTTFAAAGRAGIGRGKAEASNNYLEVTGGNFTGELHSGWAEGAGTLTANGNTTILREVTHKAEATSTAKKWFAGGYADGNSGTGDASENKTYITDSTMYTVNSGAAVGTGNTSASGNILNITRGSSRLTYGGYSESSQQADACKNNVSIDSSTIEENLYGGYADGATKAVASSNTVGIYGGTYKDIYGGRAMADDGTAEAAGNTVLLGTGSSGEAPCLEASTIYGGYASVADKPAATSGNTLKFVNVAGMKAVNIRNFQSLSYEYTEMKANDVILELTGTDSDTKTSVADADVNVSVASLYGADGQGEFKLGDKVVLLKNDNGIETDGITTKAAITAKTGISLTYEVEVQANDTELYLTRTGTKSTVLPGTKAIAEGAAAGLALASESSNATMEFLHDFTLSSGLITPFVHTQASSMRHETGSSINMSTVSLLAGLGTGIETAAGKLSAGAFFEYGKGSYTTNNSFDDRSDIDGDGNSWYMGGGILAKMDFLQTGPGHFYLEGSAHMGTLHNEYDSNDLYDASGNVAKFDMDSPYYSLHGGIGYVWDITGEHELDVYGKYIWTRVQGTDDTLTTKDRFEYDDMDSNRVRFGVRYSYKGSERFSPYVGAAFEHEFSGSCESTAYGHPVAAPSLEGSSGMGELGIIMKPAESLPLSINLGVQGFVGQKQGISGSCNVMYEF